MSDIAIRPATAADIPVISELAGVIWRAHYPGLITHEQIDYMLAQRYNPIALAEEIETVGHRLDALWMDGVIVGYANYFRYSPTEMKLDKLYLHPDLHGQGHGSRLLEHVFDESRKAGCSALILCVNKGNEKAMKSYLRNGFSVRESICVDIGGGFVMDDFVLEKSLA
ncbi:GNAT family N-acetyltransferase [Parachitinimonas caeni]|uniref:GNAT family N-acetyltransferase n=1 Tax=Parachitinimonas caeni TaxID=3031301 RepID=A0ABT7DUV6_9NEIS|nr:GNAT family N-acetyltransferase [Parachitinimonas caeni]MDK2123840.1 GNAT family N-acetyltransferase [Parachitinimonas caeni]